MTSPDKIDLIIESVVLDTLATYTSKRRTLGINCRALISKPALISHSYGSQHRIMKLRYRSPNTAKGGHLTRRRNIYFDYKAREILCRVFYEMSNYGVNIKSRARTSGECNRRVFSRIFPRRRERRGKAEEQEEVNAPRHGKNPRTFPRGV